MEKTYEVNRQENPLGTEPIGKLLRKFAVPSIISMLVMSLYNIVDQIFIGQTVGELGNAATNVAFPLTTLCIAAALTFGIGGASGFNLNLGAGDDKKAPYFIGNGATMMLGIGIILAIIVFRFNIKYSALCDGIYKNHCHRLSHGDCFCRRCTFNQSRRQSEILHGM